MNMLKPISAGKYELWGRLTIPWSVIRLCVLVIASDEDNGKL